MDLFEGLTPLDVGRVPKQGVHEFFDHQCRFSFGCLNVRSTLVEPKFKVPGDIQCPPMMSTGLNQEVVVPSVPLVPPSMTRVQIRDPLLPDRFLYWSKRRKKVGVVPCQRKWLLSRESPEDLEDSSDVSWSPERKKAKK